DANSLATQYQTAADVHATSGFDPWGGRSSDMSGYTFEAVGGGYKVFAKKRMIGTIHPTKEVSGRHCFYLGCDKRSEPRTYRGMRKAAEALEVIDGLKRDSDRHKWSQDVMIVNAWDRRPQASP
ncbi:MAG TPA: hypothetical protein VIY86_05750, partial [Pirellulaceae bacterium]